MTVYADILFLTNLLMNSVILYLSQKLAYLKINYFKILLSAAFGSLYAVAVFIYNMSFLNTILLKLAISICMVYIVNGLINLKDFLRCLAMLYVISFICCGAATCAMYIKGQNSIVITQNGAVFSNMSMRYMLIALAFTTIAVYFAAKLKRRKTLRSFESVKIELLGKSVCLKALVDTGNMLYEPISGYPVVIAEYDVIKEILPENFNLDNEKALTDYGLKIRYIPYSALGNNLDVMIGFVPDSLTVNNCDVKCCVAIYSGNLAQKHEYCALVSPDICTEERSKVYE